ncbi:class I SAM-dependent methyltransferase [Nocardia brevicatena]|uniref:class I SAM-dependent methyltransferase n=1 Tax=Nocardia brevicatena TaxID=37327 RepID=UPI001FE05EEF|nr:class I SAM-dependent methyltransferase [Nocardia brevicatena]
MPTLSHGRSRPPYREPHEHRRMAESFGVDPERYDRARPRYPDALVERIIAAAPGLDVLDVGCGTGIEARQFQAAGCTVLGVDPDARMAEFARRTGIEVEVSTFEAWDPANRMFDAVVAGQHGTGSTRSKGWPKRRGFCDPAAAWRCSGMYSTPRPRSRKPSPRPTGERCPTRRCASRRRAVTGNP